MGTECNQVCELLAFEIAFGFGDNLQESTNPKYNTKDVLCNDMCDKYQHVFAKARCDGNEPECAPKRKSLRWYDQYDPDSKLKTQQQKDCQNDFPAESNSTLPLVMEHILSCYDDMSELTDNQSSTGYSKFFAAAIPIAALILYNA